MKGNSTNKKLTNKANKKIVIVTNFVSLKCLPQGRGKEFLRKRERIFLKEGERKFWKGGKKTVKNSTRVGQVVKVTKVPRHKCIGIGIGMNYT